MSAKLQAQLHKDVLQPLFHDIRMVYPTPIRWSGCHEEAVEALKNLDSLASQLDGVIRQFRLEHDKQSGGTFKNQGQMAHQHSLRPSHV